jgi:protein-S-isoprenylcysteine O-methyltransferase Ste14
MRGSQFSKRQLVTKVIVRLTAGFVILLGVFLLSAGTMAYWEAWAYLAILFLPMTLVFVYLLKHDPELLERRMRTKEKEAEQSRIIKLGWVCYVLAFLLPGFDRRFDWSHVPVVAVAAADLLVLLGYGLFIRVLRENSYASRVVEVEQGQRVVTTGPYAIVRHPMYVAVIIMFVFTPVALGSWWAVIPAAPMIAVLVARIRNEEQVLLRELRGYSEYVQVTKYRLIPGVW